MARLPQSLAHYSSSSIAASQTGLAGLSLFICAFALFMCVSHSRRWRRWTACYRGSDNEPVIDLQRDGMMFSPPFAGGGGGAQSQQLSGPMWQKHILMGGKCELPDFSGVILYDPAGNVVTPSKPPRLALPWK